MIKSVWTRTALTMVALAQVSSCAVQRVNESFDRAEQQGRTATQYAKFLQNQQPQQNRDTVVFSHKPWVSTEPLVATR